MASCTGAARRQMAVGAGPGRGAGPSPTPLLLPLPPLPFFGVAFSPRGRDSCRQLIYSTPIKTPPPPHCPPLLPSPPTQLLCRSSFPSFLSFLALPLVSSTPAPPVSPYSPLPALAVVPPTKPHTPEAELPFPFSPFE